MKKILFLTLFILSLLPIICNAGNFVVKSDSKSFNPLSGTYSLQGNVYVEIPVRDSTITITGDSAQVKLYSAEVHAEKNISLSYDGLTFKCDVVDVKASQEKAFVQGNMKFIDGNTTITADSGIYCWKTKLASFNGNVKINDKKQDGAITYNVMTKKVLKQ